MRPWQTPQKYVQNIWPNVCEWLCMHIDRLNLSIAMMFYWKILQIPARLPEMVGGTIYRNPSFLGRNKTWISVGILLTPIHWPNRTRPSTFWPEVKGHRRHGASQCQKKEQVEDAWSSFYPVKNREYCIPEWFIYQTKMVPGICWNMLQEDVEETPCDNPSSEHSDLAPTLSLWGIVFFSRAMLNHVEPCLTMLNLFYFPLVQVKGGQYEEHVPVLVFQKRYSNSSAQQWALALWCSKCSCHSRVKPLK